MFVPLICIYICIQKFGQSQLHMMRIFELKTIKYNPCNKQTLKI